VQQTPQTPLNELQVRVLLCGSDDHARRLGGGFRAMQFHGFIIRHPQLWREHEEFLLAEAKRLRIPRPLDESGRPGLYFGENIWHKLGDVDDAS
jgi:hypothetical protein